MEAQLVCPRCASTKCARIRRKGFWQLHVLGRLGFFPWECGDCRNVFTFKKRGKRRQQRQRPQQEARDTQPSA